MNEQQIQQQIKAEKQYLGRPCWKTTGHKTIHTGVIRQIRLEGDWVEGHVYWQTKNGEDLQGHPNNWERVSNLGFEALPRFYPQNRADLTTGTPSGELTPWSNPLSVGWEDCQGISEDEEATQLTLEFVHADQSAPPKNRGKQSVESHPHRRAPKRGDQSEEANRQVNYRALLALIDGRKRDDWHVLQLNEALKREGCNTITLPAFIMRADKFQKSFERSLLAGNTYRIEEFLRTAFNGDWHGSINRDSIWGQF
jgi:hypothetical protein